MEQGKRLSASSVLKYMVLPGVVPRLKELCSGEHGSSLGWIAYLMAVVYYSVRLLPPNHPYINSANMGRFGIRHVVAEAANNLTFKWQNTDQIIVFGILLAAFVLLIMQFLLLVMALLVNPVFAQAVAPAFSGMFTTVSPENDIAFMMLDKVFAVPDLFGSKYAPVGPDGIPPFNKGLHVLFRFYNNAILIVGALIFVYFLFVVVGETAQSGTPFGQRFSQVWAPIRLVVAVSLLIPLNYGYNTAQYITFYAAKMGSGFATNGWILFNKNLDNALGESKSSESLLARPNKINVDHLVKFMSLVQTCRAAYETDIFKNSLAKDKKYHISPYLVDNLFSATKANTSVDVKNDKTGKTKATSYKEALRKYKNRDIIIRFGDDVNIFKKGGIQPFCGEIRIYSNDVHQVGAMEIQEAYYDIVLSMWNDEKLIKFGKLAAAQEIYPSEGAANACDFLPMAEDVTEDEGDQICRLSSDKQFMAELSNSYSVILNASVAQARKDMINCKPGGESGCAGFKVPLKILERGWGGAGIWYNGIARWNGALFSAAINVPAPQTLPEVMEEVKKLRRKQDETVQPIDMYNPFLKDGKEIKFTSPNGAKQKVARALNGVYQYWEQDRFTRSAKEQRTGNVVFDVITALFGAQGLFDIRNNRDVHPLAQLVAIGKSIVDSAVRNLMIAMSFAAGGGMIQIMGAANFGASLEAMSGMFASFTTIGLTIGFILYYILPFLPFMYFFFALSGWVKGIFEAMIGVPLWALAHLRIDGDGLPGEAASNGYFLIFEIFIRPILTVFGLIAGLAIFSAQVRVLNDIFDLVLANLTGSEGCTGECLSNTAATSKLNGSIELSRNVIDEFFYTIVYTIIVYMMATSSFKLIDKIPNSIMRWMGSGVKTYNDEREDPAGGLTRYAAFGGSQIAGQMTEALTTGAKGIGQTVGLLGEGILAPSKDTEIKVTGNAEADQNALEKAYKKDLDKDGDIGKKGKKK